MNSPSETLRDSIAKSIWRSKPGAIEATKTANEILSAILNKLPEKMATTGFYNSKDEVYTEAWNTALDTIKQILEEQ